MKLIPLGENLIVRPLAAEEKTAGGIVLPDTAREKPQQGRVLATGDGRRLKDGRRADSQVRDGDRVLYARYAGAEVEVRGEKLLILAESDILAVLG